MWRGVSRFDLCNLIHTSDEGLEYYLQFRCCFPEKDVRCYCGYADAAISVRNEKKQFVLANTIDMNRNVEYYGVSKKFIYNGTVIELISYITDNIIIKNSNIEEFINQTNKQGGFISLGVMPIEVYSDSIFNELSSRGVQAAIVFDNSFTLEQSKNLQDYLEKYDMIPLGGVTIK